jgi:hypothetical protein
VQHPEDHHQDLVQTRRSRILDLTLVTDPTSDVCDACLEQDNEE